MSYLLRDILKPIVGAALRLSFRKIFVYGVHRIPKEGPVIFVGNHQAALIDSLLMATQNPRNPFFLARADLFNKPFQANLLGQLRMLPIYRIRDGIDQLGKNEEIFDRCAAILKDSGSVALFPEGNHHHQRRIRPLKKGLARLLLKCRESGIPVKKIQVIPFGIHYEDHFRLRTRVRLEFGEAVDIADFLESKETDTPKASRSLLENTSTALQKYTLHYSIQEKIAEKELIRKAFLQNADGHKPIKDRFSSEQEWIEKMEKLQSADDPKFLELIGKATTFKRLAPEKRQQTLRRSTFKVYDKGIVSHMASVFFLELIYWLCFPFWGIPGLICQRMSVKLTKKDRMFFTTVWFASALLIYPMSFLLWILVLSTFFAIGWGFLVFFIWMILTWTLLNKDFLWPGLFSIRSPDGDPELLPTIDLSVELPE